MKIESSSDKNISPPPPPHQSHLTKSSAKSNIKPHAENIISLQNLTLNIESNTTESHHTQITPIPHLENTKSDKILVSLPLALIAIIAILLALHPESANHTADKIFEFITDKLGAIIQVVVLLCLIFSIYIAISKYGHIKLGDQKPEYKTLPWLFMFICAGLGATTLYWAIIEWGYYYSTPGLNIAPESKEALKFSTSFSLFHWGVGAWACYCVVSIIMAYHFHVRKNEGLSLSSVIFAVYSAKTSTITNIIIGKIVDLIFLIASIGALTLSVSISAKMLGTGFSSLFGISNTFAFQASITIICACVFCLSSYIGIDKGMQSLSNVVGYGSILFVAVLFIIGPSEFILNNVTNSIGLLIQNFFEMSLSTDPLGSGEFTKNWSIYFWLWWFSYSPGVAMFVARVSAGRSIKEVVIALIIGGGFGCWFYFGVLESYSIHQFINGTLDLPKILKEQSGDVGVLSFFSLLPFGKFFLGMFLFLMIIFLASHVDAVGYAMAATSTKNLQEGQDPASYMKLFWCILITLIPLAILYIDAPLSTIKTSVVITGLPFLVILLIVIYGFIKWLVKDYGAIPAHLVESHTSGERGLGRE